MTVRARFLEGPNEAIVIVDVEPQQLTDTQAAARFCAYTSKALGGAPVLLRCQRGETVAISGDRHLHRYGLDPQVDALPVVNVNLAP